MGTLPCTNILARGRAVVSKEGEQCNGPVAMQSLTRGVTACTMIMIVDAILYTTLLPLSL